jgi:cell division transport system permease protein
MKTAGFGAVNKRLLHEGRFVGPMPWVISIMMFLTVLSAAAGLGLNHVTEKLEGGGRITIQIVEAEEASRESQAVAALAVLRGQPGIVSVRRIGQEDLRELLKPWLGSDTSGADIPIPAMIEVDLSLDGRSRFEHIRADVIRAAPSARVDDNADWLAPLRKLTGVLRGLAAALVLLMAGATAATVVLATRAAFNTHQATIEILHMMGATDDQMARLFQRRIAFDALFGGAIGLAGAIIILWIIGERASALGSELIGSVTLSLPSWLMLCALPVGGILLAILVARLTILRALSRFL